MVWSPSGKARVCKTLIVGSILTQTSKKKLVNTQSFLRGFHLNLIFYWTKNKKRFVL
jgi:hypothetical protein